MPSIRFLNFDDLFYAEPGRCRNCQRQLTGRARVLCGQCQDAYNPYLWTIVAGDLLDQHPNCTRCGSAKNLEAAHMLSVQDILRRFESQGLKVKTLSQFVEERKAALGRPASEEKALPRTLWTPHVETAWRKQIKINREYMRQVLNRTYLKVLCRGCHDYSHAREDLQRRLKEAPAGSVQKRLVEAKLRALDALNTRAMVRRFGYRPYTEDFKAVDPKPLRKHRGPRAKRDRDLSLTRPLTAFHL